MTTYLVQNIETFETITTFASTAAFDAWMDESTLYGIVSLDTDPDGEYNMVALVAPVAGPDFVMDETTGEMEPVEDIDPAAELAAKLDIAFEIDNADEELFAAITVEDAAGETTITTKKPRKSRKSKTKSRTKAKGANMSQPKKIRNYEILAAFIEKYPGVSRTDVFCHQDLLQPRQ